MKKRMTSLVLALAMCLSLCTTVFAQDSTCEITKESLTPEQLEIYNADMKAFRRTLIDVAMLTIDSVDEDSSFTYQYNISDTLKNLIKIKYTSEIVTLDIYEGDRHDVVNYLPEGIEVDGELFPRETATTRARAYEYLASPAPGFDSGPYTSDHIVRKNRYDLAKKNSGLYYGCTLHGVGNCVFPRRGLDGSGRGAIFGDQYPSWEVGSICY